MNMFGTKFNGSSCKTKLKMVTSRIKLLRNKREIQLKQMRREIANLLKNGQEPSARIRVEHIIREQNIMDAYDLIELFCELIVVRLPIIESQRECPPDLKEAICSIIFAAPRSADLPELLEANKLFTAKFGKEFVASALELRPECGVNRKIIEKLSVRAPSGQVKLDLLKEIADQENVDWDATLAEKELLSQPEDLLNGFMVPDSSPTFMPPVPQARPEAGPSSVTPPQPQPAPVVTPTPVAPVAPVPAAAKPAPAGWGASGQAGRHAGHAQSAAAEPESPLSQSGDSSTMFVPFVLNNKHSRMGSLGQRAYSNVSEGTTDPEEVEDYDEDPEPPVRPSGAAPGRGTAARHQPSSSPEYEQLQTAAREAATAAENAAVAARNAARLAGAFPDSYTRQLSGSEPDKPGSYTVQEAPSADSWGQPVTGDWSKPLDRHRPAAALGKATEPGSPFFDIPAPTENVGGSAGGAPPGYRYARAPSHGSHGEDGEDVSYSVSTDSAGAPYGLRPDAHGSAEKYPFDRTDSLGQEGSGSQRFPRGGPGGSGGGQPAYDDSYTVINEAPPSGLVYNGGRGRALAGGATPQPGLYPGAAPPSHADSSQHGLGQSVPPTAQESNEDLDDDMDLTRRMNRLRPGRH